MSATQRRIAILPDTVANQIAAGEVVERPASVAKELIENALDAGAAHLRISVENGGRTLIEVADDGSGMSRDDAIASLDRHATSKIRRSGDLVGISSFGFRGEAIPAIASVSRFSLYTALEGGLGTAIEVAGGRITEVRDEARQRGTTVVVRSLFFNTPARRKFLRSSGSESRVLTDTVNTLALAHPEVGFELRIDGRVRLQVAAEQSLDERLIGVWGSERAASLVGVDHTAEGIRVVGFAQRPADARPTGRQVQLFVNGRPFRDPFLIRAAESGYRSTIHPGDRPSLLLDLQLDPALVDVNVHPAKLEVRFRDRFSLERVVEAAIRLALGEPEAAASLGRGVSVTGIPLPGPVQGGQPEHRQRETPADLFAPLDHPPTQVYHEPREAVVEAWDVPVFQLARTYLCYEADNGLVLVDQHSAHERVIYEEVMRQLTDGTTPAQRLLLPFTLELTEEELNLVAERRDLFTRVGFEMEPFGGRTVAVHGVPNPHPRFDAEACFREMVSDLAANRFGGWTNQLEKFAATYACRAAVKAGQSLDSRSIRELLLQLHACDLPPHDVHGRSTIVQLPFEEVERRFGRR